MVCQHCHLGLDWKGVDLYFIAHGTSLETEFNFYLTGDLPKSIAGDLLRALSVLLADLILVWRCWVLYGGNLKVIALPALCVITETVSACIAIVSYVEDIHFISASRVNWTLVYYSMTVATNSLCTVLILFRIVRVSGLGASLKTYRGIIEILVESAAMYAIIYIALLIAYAYQFYTGTGVAVFTAEAYPQIISFSITGIVPTLIIGADSSPVSWLVNRVPTTHGRAHPSRTCGAVMEMKLALKPARWRLATSCLLGRFEMVTMAG
ncbi:hypothetical protein BDZ89DRAFT_244633 [Hymenopellis radicata]|nr:hypothetical protein BDZ89DRAFT_244633 [Hymenopellis radicata]